MRTTYSLIYCINMVYIVPEIMIPTDNSIFYFCFMAVLLSVILYNQYNINV